MLDLMTVGALRSAAVNLVYVAIHILDAMGFIVIFISACQAFWDYWTTTRGERLQLDRLRLAEGLATGLEFKLGSEILRTVLVQTWEEILIVGAIVLLRAVMALMINWEIRHHRKLGRPRKISEAE